MLRDRLVNRKWNDRGELDRHPFDGAPEQKVYHESLGRMRITLTARIALLRWPVLSGM
jgi:hypothetical protein